MESIIYATLGGSLIGLSAAGMLLTNGRILGVSGILGGIFKNHSWNLYWRLSFIVGMLIGATLIEPLGFSIMSVAVDRSKELIMVGGFLVGVGTIVGSGCTSGHGVCGLSRLSIRSFVATGIFMSSAIITVLVLKVFGIGL